jgi:hypothetical protein
MSDKKDEGVEVDAPVAAEPTFVEYSTIGDRWPIRPTDTWVTLHNPRDVEARADCWLGPDARIGVALEQQRPEHDRLPIAEIERRLKTRMPVRREYLYVRFRVPAGGELRIPREFLPAIRKVRDGLVIGGLIPFIEVVDESEPPSLHPSLLPPTPPAAPRRRVERS